MDEKAGHHIHLDDPDTVVGAIHAGRDATQRHTSIAKWPRALQPAA
jgi:hypothetical protein